MAFDAFISYSSKDKLTANAACAALESAGIRCWMAPRDIRAGLEYAAGIIEGIDASRVMILIFSANANASPQIHREIERAVSKGLTIIPFRIEEIAPTQAMEYYLGAIHWLDAITPPLAKHLEQLTETVKAILKVDPAASPPAGGGSLGRLPVSGSPAMQASTLASVRSKRWPLISGVAALILLVAGAVATWTQAWPDLFARRQAATTQTQQILLNIVRASYDEPLDFSSAAANTAALKPIDLGALGGAILAGYPPELLLWLFTDQFQLYLGTQGIGYKYNPPDDYGCSRTDPRHRCYVDWVHVATIVGINVQTKSVGAAPNTLTYSRFCFDPILAQQAAATMPADMIGAVIKRLDMPSGALYDSPLSCRSAWDPTASAGQAQPGIAPLVLDQANINFNINPRSVEGMFRFLGTLLRLQRDQIKPSNVAYVPPDRDDVIALPILLSVHSDQNLLTINQNSKGPCFVETRLNNVDYCVPSQASTTKNIFSFLIQLLGYSSSRDS